MRAAVWLPFVVLALVSCLGCGSVFDGAKAGSVAIVDLDEIARRLGRDLQMNEQVAQREQAYNEQLVSIQSQIREQLAARSEALGETPTEAQKQELEKIPQQLAGELTQARHKARADVLHFRRRLVDHLREELKPVARQAAAERGLTIVMTKNDSVVFDVAPECDVTEAVIAKLQATATASRPAAETEPVEQR